jgi:deazaflavin-dependent oxidoreductase (nitroreductase family)
VTLDPSETPIDPREGWVARHLARYVASDGAEGHEWQPGVPTLLLTTRGRRSGKARRTPLIYGRDGDRYVVMASYGGAPHDPDWYVNLEADPDVIIQVGSEVMRARAATVGDDRREELWATMAGIWPDYDVYATKTDRTIPLVTLEPVTG